MIARVLLLAVAMAVAGCATTSPQGSKPEPAKEFRPLPSYAADPFVPINVYINPNEQSSNAVDALVQYAAEQLRDSGAFVRVDQGVQRWPITLQARYALVDNAASGDTTWRVLGWLTLGLVPVHVTQTHTLFAEVLTEPDSVGAVEVSVTVSERVSLYDLGDPLRGERAAVQELLERLLAEIAQRKLAPRWSEFKPDPKKKPKAPEPEGRPT